MENVLKIRKAPTNSEIPAKTSSAVEKKPSPSLISADVSALLSAAVTASAVAGSSAPMRAARASSATPSSAATAISWKVPGAASSCLRRLGLEGRQRGAGEAVGVTEADRAGHRHVQHAGGDGHLDPVTDLDADPLRGDAVDGDLAGTAGRTARAQGQGLQRAPGCMSTPERRRTAGLDRLAVDDQLA
jgi:hypothetical protein